MSGRPMVPMPDAPTPDAPMPEAPMPETRMPGNRPFPPRVSAFTRPFWDGLAAHRMLTTRCDVCGTLSFPPRNLCRDCWSRTIRWVTLAPRGTLYSFTRVHVVPGAFSGDAPYAIGIVDLEKGPRLMCRMLGEVHTGHLDGPIEMIVMRYDDGVLFAARVVDVPANTAQPADKEARVSSS